MLPNFLIIGSSKCGTTALYYYLKQHPEISFPRLKEPKYFSSIDQNFPHKGGLHNDSLFCSINNEDHDHCRLCLLNLALFLFHLSII